MNAGSFKAGKFLLKILNRRGNRMKYSIPDGKLRLITNNYQQSGNNDSFLSILRPSYHIQLLIHIKQAIRRIVVSQRCYNPSFIILLRVFLLLDGRFLWIDQSSHERRRSSTKRLQNMVGRANVAKHILFRKIECDSGMEASTVSGTIEVSGVCVRFN